MGAGLALYCRPGGAETIVASARELGLEALRAGSVESGPREVVLEPVGVRYDSEQLELSAASGAGQA
jgi:phosphoribosylformylglycinamidine cyclo-ligase